MACSILVSWLGFEPRTPSNESVKSWVLTTGQPGNFFHFFPPKLYWEYDVTFCEDWLPFKDQLHWCNISRPRSCEVHGNVIATKKKKKPPESPAFWALVSSIYRSLVLHLWTTYCSSGWISAISCSNSIDCPVPLCLPWRTWKPDNQAC